MYYTASSVKKALNASSEGELGCPLIKEGLINPNLLKVI